MKKEADEAKKAAAELTARLEALKVEAKARKEVIVSRVSLYRQRAEKRAKKGPFSFVPFLSCGEVLGNGCMSHKCLFQTGNRNRGPTFAHQTALSLPAALCRDTALPCCLLGS